MQASEGREERLFTVYAPGLHASLLAFRWTLLPHRLEQISNTRDVSALRFSMVQAEAVTQCNIVFVYEIGVHRPCGPLPEPCY